MSETTRADAEIAGWVFGPVKPAKSLFEVSLMSQSATKRLPDGSMVTAHAKSHDESELLEQIVQIEERTARRRAVRVKVRS